MSEYKDKIIQYLKQYPNFSNTAIAKMIVNETRNFGDVEKIRSLIRYTRGVSGDRSRKYLKDKTFQEEYYAKQELPKPEEYTDYAPYRIEGKRILVLADTHIPDHNPQAIKTAIEYGKTKGIDTVVLLGDIIDGYQISKFTKDPRKPSINNEINRCKELLGYIRQEFPKAKIIYKAGNHDGMRLQHYLYKCAPEISDLDALKLENLLECKKYDVKYLYDMKLLKAGKLLLLHGHELGGNPSVNIARSLYVKVTQNILFGHFHRAEEYIDTNPITRETRGSYAIGCLSNTQPDYRPYSKYQLGFALVELDQQSNFRIENKTIIKNNIIN